MLFFGPAETSAGLQSASGFANSSASSEAFLLAVCSPLPGAVCTGGPSSSSSVISSMGGLGRPGSPVPGSGGGSRVTTAAPAVLLLDPPVCTGWDGDDLSANTTFASSSIGTLKLRRCLSIFSADRGFRRLPISSTASACYTARIQEHFMHQSNLCRHKSRPGRKAHRPNEHISFDPNLFLAQEETHSC